MSEPRNAKVAWPAFFVFSGLAALAIIGEPDALDLDALLHWAATKQRGFEGGFQGRTQKLVDSCYSFWLVRIAGSVHTAHITLQLLTVHSRDAPKLLLACIFANFIHRLVSACSYSCLRAPFIFHLWLSA